METEKFEALATSQTKQNGDGKMTVQVLDKYAKARDDVLRAVREIRRNKLSNPNIMEKRVCYMEIRCWIKINLATKWKTWEQDAEH